MKKIDQLDLSELWQRLSSSEEPVIEQVWPKHEAVSFLEALGRVDAAKLADLETTYKVASTFQIVPILAVAGLINSGKSSLVASFLAPESRRRVLIGEESTRGTQRFTLWVPSQWREDAPFFERLEAMLTAIFRHAPEPLSEQPEDAHRQQREQDSLQTPLLAADDRLNDHGIALLDCPDVQRPQKNEKVGENLRLDALAKASELCAGVIVVAPRTALEIRDLQSIIDRMPKATRIYAINYIRMEHASEVWMEARRALRLDGEFCYGAYDFLVDANASYAPSWDENFKMSPQERQRRGMPCFFELSENGDASREGEVISEERSIVRLSNRIPAEAMRQKRQIEMRQELHRKLRNAYHDLRRFVEQQNREVESAAQRLSTACYQLVHEGGETRIKMDPEIIESFKESMERTAPWYLKPFIVTNRHLLNRAMKAVKSGWQTATDFLRLSAVQRMDLAKMRERLSTAMIEPEPVQRMLGLWSGLPAENWKRDAQIILRRYREEERTNMRTEEWDELTSEMWKATPRFKGAVKVIGAMFLALTALVLIPFDAGLSVVGVTVLELVGFIGFGHLVGTQVYYSLARQMERNIGEQQFSNFHAIVCDQAGVPRRDARSGETQFCPPRIEEKINPESYGIRDQGWRLLKLNESNLGRIFELIR